ncbi:MFS transporter [Kibdelosporangium aridum]|uniref:MFS transporter n=1 Tax=Kibdelosporangium aridum TaxID=2030 RepID=UPI00068B59D7
MGTAPHNLEVTPQRRRRIAAAAAAAGVVEWYDFLIFSTASALVFGRQFFPAASPVTGVLASFATFFVGFVARPLGGLAAGHWGDRIGRKPVLVLALSVMGVATALVGVLPTFAVAGVLAPIALVVLRVVQGLAVGAMWGGATLLATEYAPPEKRGLYGALVTMSLPLAVVLSNGVFLIVTAVAPGAAFLEWGWRAPFLLGGLVLLLARYMHRAIPETPEFSRAARTARTQRFPLGRVVRHYPGRVALAAASYLLGTAFASIQLTGLLDYATRVLHVPRQTVLTIVLIASVVFVPLIPLFASLSDRFGRLRVYFAGAVAIAVWAIPYFLLIDTANVVLITVAVVIGMVVTAPLAGPQATLFAELFPPEVRYTGASLAYQISGLAGGLAPLVMVLLLAATNTSLSVSALLIVLALITVGAVILLRRGTHAESPVPEETTQEIQAETK